MKRVFSVVLSFILIFNLVFISFSYADTISDLNKVEIGEGIDNLEELNPQSGEDDTPLTAEINTTNKVEGNGVIGQILSGLVNAFTGLLSVPLAALIVAFPTIDGCIFNIQDTFKLSFFDAKPVGLASSLQVAISSIYNAFRYLVVAAYIVILVYLAIRIMISSIGRQKAHYKELFKHWLVGLLLIFSFHWVMAFIIWIANTLVGILATLSFELLSEGPSLDDIFLPLADFPVTSFLLTRITGISDGRLASITNILTPILAPVFYLLLIGSTFGIIITYFKRLVTVAILILLFPLVALSYVFDKIGDRKAQTLGIWLKEFVVNVMIQPIHALILVFISLLFASGIRDVNTAGDFFGASLFGSHLLGAIMSLAALRLIPMGEELLKKLFQINSSMGPGSGGIAGSMARAGLAYKSAKDMAGSLKKIGKNASTARALYKQNGLGDLRKKALSDARAAGQTRRDARKDLQRSDEYKKFKKDLENKTGAKSIAGIYAKTAGMASAASFGVGTAVTGAKTGDFLAQATARAALGAEAVEGLSKLPKQLDEFMHGDAKKAEEIQKLLEQTKDPNKKLNDLQIEKIAATIGMDADVLKKLIHSDDPEEKKKGFELAHTNLLQMDRALRWGQGEIDLKKAAEFTDIYKESKRIKNRKDPETGGELEPDDYVIEKTNKSALLRHRKTDKIHYVNDFGSSTVKPGRIFSLVEEYETDDKDIIKVKGQKLSKDLVQNVLDSVTSFADASGYTEAIDEQNRAKIARDEAKKAYEQARKNTSLDPAKIQEFADASAKANRAYIDANKQVQKIVDNEYSNFENANTTYQQVFGESFFATSTTAAPQEVSTSQTTFTNTTHQTTTNTQTSPITIVEPTYHSEDFGDGPISMIEPQVTTTQQTTPTPQSSTSNSSSSYSSTTSSTSRGTYIDSNVSPFAEDYGDNLYSPPELTNCFSFGIEEPEEISSKPLGTVLHIEITPENSVKVMEIPNLDIANVNNDCAPGTRLAIMKDVDKNNRSASNNTIWKIIPQ